MTSFKATSVEISAKQVAAMRRKAEATLRQQQRQQSVSALAPSTADPLRLLHELQVHQIELEMQNAELMAARKQTDMLLEKYTDLYDFAPVGYFTLDEQGRIQEVNLTGATMLGAPRSQLIAQRLAPRLTAASQADFLGFLQRIFAGFNNQVCEVAVIQEAAAVLWGNLHGLPSLSSGGQQDVCRVVLSDIGALKQAEEAQHRLEALAASTLILEQEIAQRKASEGSLKKKSRHHRQLLTRSRQMHQQLRQLSHHMMSTQDDQHRQISHELYGVISQALADINVGLEIMKQDPALGSKDLDGKINHVRQSVQDSMKLVDRFSRQLHPTTLDDLGLIPALRSYVQAFSERTGMELTLQAFAGVEKLSLEKKTSLYHFAQDALAHLARLVHHAHQQQAAQISVKIYKIARGACVKIIGHGMALSDAGPGAVSGAKPSGAKKTQALAILGMQERVEMIGGSFAVESSKNPDSTTDSSGTSRETSRETTTTISACIPFAKGT